MKTLNKFLIAIFIVLLVGCENEPYKTKMDIFYEQVNKMGLLNCIEYKITEFGVWVLEKDSTVSFYSTTIHLGTLEPGESKEIIIGNIK